MLLCGSWLLMQQRIFNVAVLLWGGRCVGRCGCKVAMLLL